MQKILNKIISKSLKRINDGERKRGTFTFHYNDEEGEDNEIKVSFNYDEDKFIIKIDIDDAFYIEFPSESDIIAEMNEIYSDLNKYFILSQVMEDARRSVNEDSAGCTGIIEITDYIKIPYLINTSYGSSSAKETIDDCVRKFHLVRYYFSL